MKKIIAVVLLTLLALSVCTCAFAEKILIDSRDLKITFTSTEMSSMKYKEGSEKPYLSFNMLVENNVGEDIAFKNGTCTVDGIETDMAVPSRIKPGANNDCIWLMAQDGVDPSYLNNWETIEMDLTVLYFDTEEVLYRFPVYIENEAEEVPQSIPYEAGGPIDIVSSSDLTITINSARMSEGPAGEVLQCSLTVNNGMGHSIDFSGSNCSVNGIKTTVGVPARADAGMSDKYMIFMPADGQSADYLRDVDSLTFDLEVSHSKTGEVICNVPVYIGGDLPGMSAQGASKQDKAASAKEKAEEKQPEPERIQYFEPYFESDMLVIATHDDFSLCIGGLNENANDDYVALSLYALVNNWSSRELDIQLEDVKFDLTEVDGGGIYNVEPGSREGDFFLLKEDNVGGDNPLLNPDWITFTVVAEDSNTYDTVAEIPVSMSGEWLDMLYAGGNPWGGIYSYPNEDDYPDYTYDDESICHLKIFPGSYCSWDGYAEGMMDIRVEVVNTHPTKTVKSFEMLMYGTEPDGDILPGNGKFYCQSTVKHIAPGEIATCDDFYIFGQTMEKFSFAVNQVEYTDGSMEIVPDGEWQFGYWYAN